MGVFSTSHGNTFVEAEIEVCDIDGGIEVRYTTGETKSLQWEHLQTQVKALQIMETTFRPGPEGRLDQGKIQSRNIIMKSWDVSLNEFCGSNKAAGIKESKSGAEYACSTHGDK